MPERPFHRTCHDEARVQAVITHLRFIEDGGPSVYRGLLPLLSDALGLEKAIAYDVAPQDETHRLTLAESTGLAPGVLEREMGALVRECAGGWGLFDPMRPEPSQRNRAMVLDLDEERMQLSLPATARRSSHQHPSNAALTPATHAPLYRMFRGLGVLGQSQLRVLICEGDALLAWVGGIRREPFGAHECRLLQAMTPALERRLALEQVLQEGPWQRLGLAAALEEVSSCAFVVDGSGAVRHANAAGRTRLDGSPGKTRKELHDAARARRSQEFRMTLIAGVGQKAHWLLVAQAPPSLDHQLVEAGKRWSLTARQGEVLALLLRGEANKSIAIHLSCAVRTVEQHVTAVLGKAGVDSRAALAAKFWTRG